MPFPIDDQTLLRIAQPAADLAMAFAARRGALSTTEKSPGQFGSEADDAIEAAIRAALAHEFGEVPIIGEETGGALDAEASGWAIDPIDGTTNFLRGLPIWGVSIGLLERGQSIAGVVCLPELNLTLTARAGAGARVNGERIAPRGRGEGGRVIALGENDFETGAQSDARAEELRRAGYAVVRYRCAIFALANAALGRLDGYVEHGCCIWDIAAAEVICREAGMDVRVAELAPGRYAIDARWA